MAAKDNQINLLPGKSLDGTMLPDISLDNIRKIAQGDLSSALTGGDKLIALSGLLRSVARGSRTTPQEAMAQVQRAALGRASTQMQLAQLEAKAAEEARLKADQQAFVATLPKKLQDTAKALRGESLDSFIKNLRMNASYKRVMEDGKPVTKVVYGSGLEETANFQLPANATKVFVGGKPVWVDEFQQIITDPATGQPLSAGDPMTPEEVARLAQGQARIDIARANAARAAARGDGAGGGSGGGKEQEVWVGGTGGKPVKTLAYRDKSSPTGWRQYGTNMVVRRVPNPGNGLLAPVTVIPAAPE